MYLYFVLAGVSVAYAAGARLPTYVGAEKDDGTSIAEGWDDVLQEDFRHPIPTGISGIDDLTDGGLSRGELGVVLAPYGVGKTTILTKIANTAYNAR